MEEERERAAQKEKRSYDRIMGSETMVSNKEMSKKYASFEEAEDDFM